MRATLAFNGLIQKIVTPHINRMGIPSQHITMDFRFLFIR